MQNPLTRMLQQCAHRGLRRIRALILALATLVALLSATIAIGQASLDFDLACRSEMTATSVVASDSNFGVISALGLAVVPPRDSETQPTYSVRSADFGVRAGFLPGYADSESAAVANTEIPNQPFVQYLPVVHRVVRMVRGGC
jgi:hypothetical protein